MCSCLCCERGQTVAPPSDCLAEMAAVLDGGARPPTMGFGLLWGCTRHFWGESAPKIWDWGCNHPF